MNMSFEKLQALALLKQGDKVELTNGKVAEFVRMKQKNFVGNMDNKSYNIPVEMFVKVVEKAPEQQINEGYKTLKENELFYITDQKKGHALLFKFKGIKNGKILGESPISKSLTRIDSSLYMGKVSEL